MLHTQRDRLTYWLVALALGAGGPTTLYADSPARLQLEEVIVVAQRREESAQGTPVSLLSFNTEQLTTLGIQNVGDIHAQVPNFQIDRFPSSNQTLRLFIRGVGNSDVQITQDPAVGVYMDGIYLARSTGLSADVADLERIEVLRGPQGTLYGRNTTGGALNLITARPSVEEAYFRQELGTGNRGRLRSKSVINLPVTDTLAVKLAALLDRQDGFVNNGGPGGDFGDRDADAFRFDLRWQASDSVVVDYAWDKSVIESFNYTLQAVTPGELTGTPVDAAILSSQRFVPYSENRFSQLDTSTRLRPNDTEIEGHSLTLTWTRPHSTLVSLTGYRELSDFSYIDFASGASSEYRVDFQGITLGAETDQPQVYDSVRTRVTQEQFSQELQILGTWVQRWDYVAGLYYFREEALEDWFPLHHIFSFPVIETGDQGVAVNIRGEDNDIENEATAAYGQLTWTPAVLDSALHLSMGWRYSRDTRKVARRFRQDNYVDFGNELLGPFESTNFSADAKQTFSDNSFSLMAQWDWTEDLHLYGKLIEAYKSGGFNTRDPDPAFFADGFDEEKNRTFELGFKGEMLDRRLRLNSAVFYSRFEDYQLNFLIPGSISDTRVFNSGEATISGLELELTAFPWYGLLCNINYAYLDSSIDDVADPFTGELRSFTLENAPRHTASANINYQFPPMSFGELSVNLNYNYVDDRQERDAPLYRSSYSLLNGEIALANIPVLGGELRLSAWIKNALDDDYVMFTIDNLPHASRAVLWGETRTWGVDVRYQI